VKAVILAGGLGTRMGTETAEHPKPLLDVGDKPILWHILKIYQAHGVSDFIICAGYHAHRIAHYFAQERDEPWRIQVKDTGYRTATGGRLRRVRHLIGDDAFCMTYGDGVADVDVTALVTFHRQEQRLVTVTAFQPQLPFGVVAFPTDGGHGVGFVEKPRLPNLWVNAGFFVIEPAALDAIDNDAEPWEQAPLSRLADAGQVSGYKHTGFWQCMDAPRDRQQLTDLWLAQQAPWKVW
jgi:glucose-1-phosphate cytidylyltransferase